MKLTVTHPFTVSKYGSYKRYHLHMLKVKAFIERNWTRLTKNFDIKGDIEVRLRPLPRRITQGRHTNKPNGHLIQLDISKGLRTLIETLFHELQHAVQCESGRLKHIWNGASNRFDWIWEDQFWGRNPGFGQGNAGMARYERLPWEEDADKVMREEFALFEQEFGRLDDTVEIYRR